MTTTNNQHTPAAAPDRADTARHVDQLHATLAALVGVDVTTAARASTLAAVAEHRRSLQQPIRWEAQTPAASQALRLPRLVTAVGDITRSGETSRGEQCAALVAVAAEALAWIDTLTEPEPDF